MKKRKAYKTHAELVRTLCTIGNFMIGLSTFLIVVVKVL